MNFDRSAFIDALLVYLDKRHLIVLDYLDQPKIKARLDSVLFDCMNDWDDSWEVTYYMIDNLCPMLQEHDITDHGRSVLFDVECDIEKLLDAHGYDDELDYWKNAPAPQEAADHEPLSLEVVTAE